MTTQASLDWDSSARAGRNRSRDVCFARERALRVQLGRAAPSHGRRTASIPHVGAACKCVHVTADREVARPTAHYPPADLTPQEFEQFVVELLESVSPSVEGFQVILHDKLEGADGHYDFDATVRFALGGMDFLVLIEAKRHTNPIKRELVQVLHDKLRSVGAHNAAMISTAPYQRGALDYAKKRGIALVTITEARFTFETREAGEAPPLTREQAAAQGIPPFVAHAYRSADQPGSTSVTLLSPDCPSYVAEVIFGVSLDGPGSASVAPKCA